VYTVKDLFMYVYFTSCKIHKQYKDKFTYFALHSPTWLSLNVSACNPYHTLVNEGKEINLFWKILACCSI